MHLLHFSLTNPPFALGMSVSVTTMAHEKYLAFQLLQAHDLLLKENLHYFYSYGSHIQDLTNLPKPYDTPIFNLEQKIE